MFSTHLDPTRLETLRWVTTNQITAPATSAKSHGCLYTFCCNWPLEFISVKRKNFKAAVYPECILLSSAFSVPYVVLLKPERYCSHLDKTNLPEGIKNTGLNLLLLMVSFRHIEKTSLFQPFKVKVTTLHLWRCHLDVRENKLQHQLFFMFSCQTNSVGSQWWPLNTKSCLVNYRPQLFTFIGCVKLNEFTCLYGSKTTQ